MRRPREGSLFHFSSFFFTVASGRRRSCFALTRRKRSLKNPTPFFPVCVPFFERRCAPRRASRLLPSVFQTEKESAQPKPQPPLPFRRQDHLCDATVHIHPSPQEKRRSTKMTGDPLFLFFSTSILLRDETKGTRPYRKRRNHKSRVAVRRLQAQGGRPKKEEAAIGKARRFQARWHAVDRPRTDGAGRRRRNAGGIGMGLCGARRCSHRLHRANHTKSPQTVVARGHGSPSSNVLMHHAPEMTNASVTKRKSVLCQREEATTRGASCASTSSSPSSSPWSTFLA